ncbi:MAG TPA: nuclear transport factor 2 family protein [Chloroflexia bacterium]|nr:nuclear transport factor 2 family protein [Chloroflexia bacterium]
MEESAEVKAIMMRYYDAITNGDVEAMDQLFSREDGVLLIGTDPNEWWPGYDKIMEIWRVQFEAVGGGFPVTSTDLRAYSEGSMGWAADRPVFHFPDGSEAPFRLTTVLHKEGDDWKVVHSHVSFGVANEEAIGQELPT